MAEDSPVTKVQDQGFPSSEGVRATYLIWPWHALCFPSQEGCVCVNPDSKLRGLDGPTKLCN